MARGRRGQGQQQSRGFRPGKEPPQLRKQRAKQQLGPDANWAQKRLVDVLSDQSPDQARAMMRRWRIALLAIAIALAVLGAFLYGWSMIAGVVVHVLAAVLLLLWFQLRRKRRDFETMADLVSGRPPGQRRPR
jgi:Flp pilus assembly protein TadB